MVEAALVRALVLASCSALTLACSEGADPASGRALEGTLEVIVVEGPHGGTRYFLMPNDAAVDPVELRFEHAPSSGSGARIAVDGSYEGGSFQVSAFDELDELDAARTGKRVEALAAAPPERSRTIAFVMVDYGEGVNVTETEAQRFMFSTTNPGPTLGIGPNDKSTLQFYDETSYGFFGVTGDVEGPLQWTGAAACNGSGGSQLASQLRSQVSTTYGHYIWYYGSRQSACEYGWGSLGNWTNPSSNVWFNGDLFDGAITHEIGHNLGYQHASSIRCSGTPLANDPMTCTTTEYGSAVSIMGNTSNGHMMAIEKWYASWFKGCNAVRVRQSGTFNLLPIENACGGVQALQIPMPVTTRTFDTQQSNNPSPARYYYLEYRNGTGLDTGMTPSVIVVASDDIAPPNRVCARSVQMDMNPSTTQLNGMTQGQTYMDPAGGLSFTVTSLTPALATVTVTMSAAAMPNTCMDGTELSGSGPTTCTGGGGGMGGTGGGAGAGGRGGNSSAGAGGAPTAGRGGAPGAGAGGAPSAGAGGAPIAGSAGSGGVSTGGAGGAPVAGAGGTPGGGPSTGGGATAGTAGIAGTPGSGGSAGSNATGGSAGSGTTSPPTTGSGDGADDAGCGCRVAGSTRASTMSLWSLALASLLAAGRRRRTRRESIVRPRA
jgi:MYXO-CTERM domain-containing protein